MGSVFIPGLAWPNLGTGQNYYSFDCLPNGEIEPLDKINGRCRIVGLNVSSVGRNPKDPEDVKRFLLTDRYGKRISAIAKDNGQPYIEDARIGDRVAIECDAFGLLLEEIDCEIEPY